MGATGLREQKRVATRRHIADIAAQLFGERGYENVSVVEVARASNLSEQTVYNYFGGKEQLVTDRDYELQNRVSALIRDRAKGVTPAAAIRDYLLETVDAMKSIQPEVWRGELAYLSAISPAVHRLTLEILESQAEVFADAIRRSTDLSSAIARLHGIAIAGVLQVFLYEAGARTRDGESQSSIASELRSVVKSLIDELDSWFTTSGQY